MPTLAVIVIVTAAVLLPAVLVVGARKAARARSPRGPRTIFDDLAPYRSHAEASRHGHS